MSQYTILSKLKAIVDTVSSSILPVKLAFVETMPSSFPAAMVRYISDDERTLDTSTNIISAIYAIHLIFPTEESAAAQQKWLECVDALKTALRDHANITLTGSATRMAPGKTEQTISMEFGQPVVIFSTMVYVEFIKPTY